MDFKEKIQILAVKNKISVQQLAKASGQASANLYNKLSRNDFKYSELVRIAEAVNATVEVNFILPNGEKI